jgi:hypothetical protein
MKSLGKKNNEAMIIPVVQNGSKREKVRIFQITTLKV